MALGYNTHNLTTAASSSCSRLWAQHQPTSTPDVWQSDRTFFVCFAPQGKGPAAAAVKDMTIKLRKETPLPAASAASCRIHRAIILDRDIDVVTPMVTQITFEGLIDEVTGIKHGSVAYTPGKRETGGGAAGGDGGRGRPVTWFLNSSDPFYREFRDLPYYITSQRCEVVSVWGGCEALFASHVLTIILGLEHVTLFLLLC